MAAAVVMDGDEKLVVTTEEAELKKKGSQSQSRCILNS